MKILHALTCVALLCILVTPSHADERAYYDLGIGPGLNLNGLETGQLLIAPAWNYSFRNPDSLRFRVEGDFEIIDENGNLTLVAGVAPFIRSVCKAQRISPFVEIGAGVNYASRTGIGGRKLGGRFFFSAMAGAGLEFDFHGREIALSYRVRHLSNGSIYSANEGLNSQYIIMSLKF